ncbi:hypothetical protein [Desulfosporosinus sp.]|uniref:hypothetical protein n=1 Tax=Desulfosporosinus sp. TaxID=157907 RepID=UPI0025BEA4AA|nr:hypothetical protein [Desulfosporosinus sp.]MBC2723111.1 hypothetical protein [Desulfosporosinus sp.]MBC2728785.1 hypothetical protein [Desulfosporosinus sp.]
MWRRKARSFATKCSFGAGGSAILYPSPEGIPSRITASAILSTGDYRTGDYRVFRHIAGVCVTSRNVAKFSSDFRIAR